MNINPHRRGVFNHLFRLGYFIRGAVRNQKELVRYAMQRGILGEHDRIARPGAVDQGEGGHHHVANPRPHHRGQGVQASDDLQLVGDVFDRQSYGFALQLGSTYRKRINEALLKLQLDGYLEELDKKWFASTAQK